MQLLPIATLVLILAPTFVGTRINRWNTIIVDWRSPDHPNDTSYTHTGVRLG
jgi:hypothetical protein